MPIRLRVTLFGYSLEELRQVGREGIIDHNDAFVLKKSGKGRNG